MSGKVLRAQVEALTRGGDTSASEVRSKEITMKMGTLEFVGGEDYAGSEGCRGWAGDLNF